MAFVEDRNILGVVFTRELEDNGQLKILTNENKKEYVKSICHFRMEKEIYHQLKAFMQGFNVVIHKSKSMMELFSPSELMNLIAGMPELDVDELEKHCKYENGYDKESEVVVWFWETV